MIYLRTNHELLAIKNFITLREKTKVYLNVSDDKKIYCSVIKSSNANIQKVVLNIKYLIIWSFDQNNVEQEERDSLIEALKIIKNNFEEKQKRLWRWIRNWFISWKIDAIQALFDEIFKLKKNLDYQLLQTNSRLRVKPNSITFGLSNGYFSNLS